VLTVVIWTAGGRFSRTQDDTTSWREPLFNWTHRQTRTGVLVVYIFCAAVSGKHKPRSNPRDGYPSSEMNQIIPTWNCPYTLPTDEGRGQVMWPIKNFWGSNHITRTAEPKVVKFCTQVGYISSSNTMTYHQQKRHGYGHVTVINCCRLSWCSASRGFVSDSWASCYNDVCRISFRSRPTIRCLYFSLFLFRMSKLQSSVTHGKKWREFFLKVGGYFACT